MLDKTNKAAYRAKLVSNFAVASMCGLLFYWGADIVVNGKAQKEFCANKSAQLTEKLKMSGLENLLQEMKDSGKVRVHITYSPKREEYPGFSRLGYPKCHAKGGYIQLKP